MSSKPGSRDENLLSLAVRNNSPTSNRRSTEIGRVVIAAFLLGGTRGHCRQQSSHGQSWITALLTIGVAAGLLAALPGIASAGPDTSSTLQQWTRERVITSHARISGGGVNGPTVVVTPSGSAVAMWLEQRPSRPPRLVVSQRRAGHRNWQSKQELARGFFGAVEAHGSDRVTVAWQSADAKYAEISAQTLRREGTWGPIQKIARWPDRGGVTVSLVLAANDRGDMVAVWTRAHYIRVAYRPAGSSWRKPTIIPVRDAYAYDAMANVSHDGQVDVVFPGPGDTHARNVFAWHRALGGAWSGESLGRMPGQRTFSAAGNPEGDLAVTWMTRDNRADPRRVVLRYQPSGGSFTQPEILAADAKLPQLDIANSGVVTVAWLARVDDLARVDLARRRLDGSYSAPQHLAQRPFSRYYGPLLGVDVNDRGDGVVHLVGRHRTDRDRLIDDHRMFRCPAGSPCGDPFRLAGPSPYKSLSFATTPFGGATAIYARGCATENCIPMELLSRRMVPLS